ncbi:hypothetical protein KIN20_001605 [Parelaphostrongylus tenuis]|uniref:Uncharacterized protein n=1 Tax=Parelaphostrongylus tenuis TaxID=148309 RepID=A0AAD5MD18_PARTN|nr:hypothetical protein KIN20_001605 [Parelaphostrongylus tenuis]
MHHFTFLKITAHLMRLEVGWLMEIADPNEKMSKNMVRLCRRFAVPLFSFRLRSETPLQAIWQGDCHGGGVAKEVLGGTIDILQFK